MVLRSKKVAAATAGASLALVAALVGTGIGAPSTAAWAAPAAPGVDTVRQATPVAKPERPGRGQGQGQGQRGNMQQQRQQMHDAYMSALAARLGLSVDQVKEAMQQSHIDLINQAVTEGKLTQEQANRRIQAIQSGQHAGPMGPGAGNQRPGRPGMGQRGPGGAGQGQGPHQGQGQRGPGGMQMGAGQEIATILGMTPQELRTELQGGKTLAQVGEAKGITRETLKAKLLEAHKAHVDAAVAAGKLTAEQAKQMTERATANVDRMLDRTPGPRRGAGTPGSGN
jgi:polyhydroxyalkanoate synthesis regulator phasin